MLTIILSLIISGNVYAAGKAPDGMMVDFLQGSNVSGITDSTPEFGWIVHSSSKNDMQSAFRILVASDPEMLDKDQADMWDSNKISSTSSINVSYLGKPLSSNKSYYWKVKTWCKLDGQSKWSSTMKFTTENINQDYKTTQYPLTQSEISPEKISRKGNGHYLIDFGKVAFGHLRLQVDCPSAQELEVHFGERGNTQGIIKELGKTTVRYYKVNRKLNKGFNLIDIHPPIDKRNTGSKAIKIPTEIGIITPFRYVELVNFPTKLTKPKITQIAVHYPFDESEAQFSSSNIILDDIWALCKYSMKATSFCGVYVDGDRERIPYEADAYINQLSHYAVDREFTLARYSHEYLLANPTWPTEWKQHSVMMAWTDYMYTGNTESIAEYYNILKSQKTLENLTRKDGLLNTKGLRDIVDWPTGERDGYDFKEVNTVVNAFYYKTLLQMADIAAALGKESDADQYQNMAAKVKSAFNEVLFDSKRGVYIDGEGSDHASIHANMMPLAFGLVPKVRQKSVTDFVISRKMACSVYGAQYLLEALYQGRRPDAALDLMTSKDIRSWYNMLRVGSTITLEAWDDRFKPNQDWNHAWGAVPGNIITRYLLGVRPIEPGFAKILIQPQPASLTQAAGTIPTIRGPVYVSFQNHPHKPFTLKVDIPVNTVARIGLPQGSKQSEYITVDGKKIKAQLQDNHLFVDNIGSGAHVFTCQ